MPRISVRIKYDVLENVGEWSKKYANLPDRYVKRAMEQIYFKTPEDPRYLPRTLQRTRWRFGEDRPWTREFYLANDPFKTVLPATVEPVKHWSFFRGDRVEILVGRDKGKHGFVATIIQERNWVIVEGLNTKLQTIGKTKDFPGIIMLKEKPLLVTTEVALVDPNDLKPTKVEWRYDESGELMRIGVRTGRHIPIPITNKETIDYKLPHLYKDQVKDTAKKDVENITFQPELKTFEMDIMEKMGIKDERVHKGTFWY